MTVMKRQEILGNTLRETREVTLRCWDDSRNLNLSCIVPGRPQQQFARQLLIMNAVAFAVLEHLGYGPMEHMRDRLNEGVDQTLEYFFGDW
ncbi:MAG: hypothetical protein MUE50_16600 [Pirellulaceae bacterium]|jgi:hypothetical protein|nr:hypothetical protein [Pirellulaceae bacterium]